MRSSLAGCSLILRLALDLLPSEPLRGRPLCEPPPRVLSRGNPVQCPAQGQHDGSST